jgi:hypothetical protein
VPAPSGRAEASDRGFIARHYAPGRGARVPAPAAGAEHLPDLSRLAGVSALAFTDIALVAFALIPAAVASAALGVLPEQPDDNLSIACAAVISQRAQRGRAATGQLLANDTA